MTKQSPEEFQAAEWAGEMGDKWLAHLDQFEGMIASAGAESVIAAGFRPGEKVIDVGCGGGATTRQIAKIVGASGHVTGLDISAGLIAEARNRASVGVNPDWANMDYLAADAATVQLGRRYDCIYSRFGVMFFADPYAAFANMRQWLGVGGRLHLCCWGPPPANPWVAELMGIVRRHVEIPTPAPRTPGPFAFADPDYVADILTRAGFQPPEFESWTGPQHLGGPGADPQAALKFLIDVTFVGDALQNQPAALRQQVIAEISGVLQQHSGADGVQMDGNVWLISAAA